MPTLRPLVSHPVIDGTTNRALHALPRQAALPASFLVRPLQHQQQRSYSNLPFNKSRQLNHTFSPFTSTLNSNSNYRSMSSSAPTRKEFLCILPDKPGMVAKRVEVRGAHLEGVKPLVERGDIVIGGAMFDAHPADGETPSFNGSMLVAAGESAEQVKEMLARDIYTTSGVWDLENAKIVPFRTAVRAPM